MSKKSNPKRDQIVRTGKELFWKFGIRRVTVEEICKEAGVSKMTFYKFFDHKMDLVSSILDEIFERAIKEYREIMDSDIPFSEKVIKTIHFKREQSGNLSNEFLVDFMDQADGEMLEYFETMKNRNISMIVEDFKREQQKGGIRKEIKVEFMVFFLNHMIDLFHDESLLQHYDDPHDLIMELTNFYFYGVLNRETNG